MTERYTDEEIRNAKNQIHLRCTEASDPVHVIDWAASQYLKLKTTLVTIEYERK